MKPNVLVIDPGARDSKQLYLERLLAYPASFWIVENSAVDCTGRWYRSLVAPERVIAADFRRPAAAVEQIVAAIRERVATVQGVTTYYEDSVEIADRVAATLELPRICHGDRARLRHKGLMRDAFGRVGVPQPAYRRCVDLADAYRAADEIGFPCIVKPAQLSASIGVRKVVDRQELAAAFTEALTIDYGDGDDSRYAYAISADVLVEEYVVSDREISCEGFACNGKVTIVGITEARLESSPSFKEAGHLMPCLLSNEASSTVRVTVEKACAALELRNSTFHAELLLRSDGSPAFLEIGARLPGGYIPFALEAATGFDLLAASIDLCLGTRVTVGSSLNRAAGIEFITDRARIALFKKCRREIESSDSTVSLLFYDGAISGRLGHLIWRASDRNALESARLRLDEVSGGATTR